MTIAEKVRERRLAAGLTQAQLASDHLTRNMICSIESGKAKPSLGTLLYLAERLNVSVRYFTEPDRTMRQEALDAIYPQLTDLLQKKRYEDAIELAERIPDVSDDPILSALLARLHLIAAEKCVAGGSVRYAKAHLDCVARYRPLTPFDTSLIGARAVLCAALVNDPLTPKYALDDDQYLSDSATATGAELYHYISDNWNYPFVTRVYALHTEAKCLMKEYRYTEALAKMESAIENKQSDDISVLVLYRIYSDMEICYRERKDYENAYRYATKKTALLTSFNR